MVPFSSRFDHFCSLRWNSACYFTPNKAFQPNQVIVFWPNRVHTLTLLSSTNVQVIQVLWWPWAWKSSWKKSINLSACGQDRAAVASSQSQVCSGQSYKRFNLWSKTRPNIVSSVNVISSLPSLDDSSAITDSHWVGNHVNFFGFCVCQYSFNKGSKIHNIFFGMVIVLSLVWISRSPCGSVEFCLGPALSNEVSGQWSESSLPGNISIGSSSSKSHIAISMKENNRDLFQFLCRVSFSSKSSTLDVRSGELEIGVA